MNLLKIISILFILVLTITCSPIDEPCKVDFYPQKSLFICNDTAFYIRKVVVYESWGNENKTEFVFYDLKNQQILNGLKDIIKPNLKYYLEVHISDNRTMNTPFIYNLYLDSLWANNNKMSASFSLQ